MNKVRKKLATDVYERLQAERSTLGGLLSDLEAEFDERSERWHEGEKGRKAQEEIDQVSDACDLLDTIMDTLDALR